MGSIRWWKRDSQGNHNQSVKRPHMLSLNSRFIRCNLTGWRVPTSKCCPHLRLELPRSPWWIYPSREGQMLFCLTIRAPESYDCPMMWTLRHGRKDAGATSGCPHPTMVDPWILYLIGTLSYRFRAEYGSEPDTVATTCATAVTCPAWSRTEGARAVFRVVYIVWSRSSCESQQNQCELRVTAVGFWSSRREDGSAWLHATPGHKLQPRSKHCSARAEVGIPPARCSVRSPLSDSGPDRATKRREAHVYRHYPNDSRVKVEV